MQVTTGVTPSLKLILTRTPRHPDLRRHGGLPEALCDFGSSVNIMPRFADQALSFPKGILRNLCVRVGTLYGPANFVVIETGNDDRAPIILGRPFLDTSGAVIYASATKISFYIKGRKETFSFKKKTA